MAKVDWKESNIFKLLQQQVKVYNSNYNLKDICIANQAAPAGVLNDVYYYIGDVTATVFGIPGIVKNSFLRYNGTTWEYVGEIEDLSQKVSETEFYEKIKEINNKAPFFLAENGVAESSNGFYSLAGTFNVLSDWKSKKFPVVPTSDYYVTSKVSGSGTALAVYYTAEGTFISYEKQGVSGIETVYTREKLNIPTNAGIVGLTNHSTTDYAVLEIKEFAPVTQDQLKNEENARMLLNTKVEETSVTIDNILASITDYVIKTGVAESSNGFYSLAGTFNVLSGWKSKKFPVVPTSDYYVTSKVSGSGTALAVYYTVEGAFISYEKQGVSGIETVYTREKLNIPTNAGIVGLTNHSTTDYAVLETVIFNVLKKSELDINNARITAIENAALDYVIKTGVAEASNGFYYLSGSFVLNESWKSKKFPVVPTSDYYVTAKVSGSPTALAIYYTSSGAFISYEKQGVSGIDTVYTREKLNVPANAAFVGLTNHSTTDYAVLETKEFAPVTETKTKTIIDEKLLAFAPSNFWKAKKIVWYGTSIPAGGYPLLVGSILEAIVTNEAKGASMSRRGKIDVTDGYGWTGLAWQNVAYSLSQTILEKQELITNWDVWKTLLGNTPPSLLDANTQAAILDCSFENRLFRHLSSKGGVSADLYVFDHGHNDNLLADTDSQFIDVPADSRNKNTFIGSVNFLIDQILSDNPRARICFIGHYSNDQAYSARVSKAQETLAKYWNFPLLKLWEKTGWSQQQITTTGFWAENGTWTNSGGVSQTIPLTQLWMKDNLHPASDLSGKANALLSSIIAEFIKSIR